jgi:hypothetical protein
MFDIPPVSCNSRERIPDLLVRDKSGNERSAKSESRAHDDAAYDLISR